MTDLCITAYDVSLGLILVLAIIGALTIFALGLTALDALDD